MKGTARHLEKGLPSAPSRQAGAQPSARNQRRLAAKAVRKTTKK
jgi:hypothetical protein